MWYVQKISDFSLKLINYLKTENIDHKIVKEFEDLGDLESHPFNRDYHCSLEMEERISGFDPDLYYSYSKAASEIGLENMLCGKYILLPFQNFIENIYFAFGLFAEDCKIFIRPNSSKKHFTGRLFDIEEFKETPSDFQGLKKDDLIVVSSPKKIQAEWRFLCRRGEILDGSLYRYQGLLTEIRSYPNNVKVFTEEMANKLNHEEPYCLDVSQEENGSIKVIETNAAKTANLYACDPKIFVENINI